MKTCCRCETHPTIQCWCTLEVGGLTSQRRSQLRISVPRSVSLCMKCQAMRAEMTRQVCADSQDASQLAVLQQPSFDWSEASVVAPKRIPRGRRRWFASQKRGRILKAPKSGPTENVRFFRDGRLRSCNMELAPESRSEA